MIPKNLITATEAAKRCYCSKRTILYAVETGKLQAWRPANTTLIDMKSLEEWFVNSKVKPKNTGGRPRKGTKR